MDDLEARASSAGVETTARIPIGGDQPKAQYHALEQASADLAAQGIRVSAPEQTNPTRTNEQAMGFSSGGFQPLVPETPKPVTSEPAVQNPTRTDAQARGISEGGFKPLVPEATKPVPPPEAPPPAPITAEIAQPETAPAGAEAETVLKPPENLESDLAKATADLEKARKEYVQAMQTSRSIIGSVLADLKARFITRRKEDRPDIRMANAEKGWQVALSKWSALDAQKSAYESQVVRKDITQEDRESEADGLKRAINYGRSRKRLGAGEKEEEKLIRNKYFTREQINAIKEHGLLDIAPDDQSEEAQAKFEAAAADILRVQLRQKFQEFVDSESLENYFEEVKAVDKLESGRRERDLGLRIIDKFMSNPRRRLLAGLALNGVTLGGMALTGGAAIPILEPIRRFGGAALTAYGTEKTLSGIGQARWEGQADKKNRPNTMEEFYIRRERRQRRIGGERGFMGEPVNFWEFQVMGTIHQDLGASLERLRASGEFNAEDPESQAKLIQQALEMQNTKFSRSDAVKKLRMCSARRKLVGLTAGALTGFLPGGGPEGGGPIPDEPRYFSGEVEKRIAEKIFPEQVAKMITDSGATTIENIPAGWPGFRELVDSVYASDKGKDAMSAAYVTAYDLLHQANPELVRGLTAEDIKGVMSGGLKSLDPLKQEAIDRLDVVLKSPDWQQWIIGRIIPKL